MVVYECFEHFDRFFMVAQIHRCLVFLILSEISETSNTLKLPENSVTIDPDTKLILFGSGNGNRLPSKFLDDGTNRMWGYEGTNELTQFGKRQAFGLGKEVREFVGSLLNNNYLPSEAKFYTSELNNCQMTLQAILAGIYPPDTFAEWNQALDWTPVPYTINDTLLTVDDLEQYINVHKGSFYFFWSSIRKEQLERLQKLAVEKRPLLDYIANGTGWNATIESASILAQNLQEIILYGADLPEWIANPSIDNYDRQRLLEEINLFLETREIACAENPECRHIMGGVWLGHILSILTAASRGEYSGKIVGYVSPHMNILSLMKLLYIKKNEQLDSGGFLIEYRDKPYASIRIRSHYPVQIDNHVISQANYEEPLEQISTKDKWIIFEKFFGLLENEAIFNSSDAYGVQLLINKNSSAPSLSPQMQTFGSIFFGFILVVCRFLL
ncbi:unnamed protein product [Dracunculus medinensis]|uniref:Uncharacterized protein n=1 Tax=Dracunculus medinensis TaxID=318479 RepID=A0A3P7PSI0_DRAME|nr:unnamed protein product [Dracunculus medinensis]